MSTLIYDFETLGLSHYHDDIIEIGCRCLESDVNTCLVQPCQIEYYAIKL